MISILIPTYNEKVDQLVLALHAQSEKLTTEFEILVYDDGSDVQFKENEAINALSNARYCYFEKNLGRGAIRNQLALDAKANFLLFLDADVLPTNNNFLSTYEKAVEKDTMVICGGIAYRDTEVPTNERLRYVYGKKREEKSADTRQNDPYIIVTANLLIQKECFLEANVELKNLYGEDLLLSQNLKRRKCEVLHIDNPVWHLGLETSSQFIEKSKEAIRNMIYWEKEGQLDSDFTVLQKKYASLQRKGVLSLYQFFLKVANKVYIAANLTSKNPSPLLFNMYRLYYYIQQKKHA
ncbi:MAG: glycosyltransferase family 2 protein [Bacteroidota bacterium]